MKKALLEIALEFKRATMIISTSTTVKWKNCAWQGIMDQGSLEMAVLLDSGRLWEKDFIAKIN
jgi:hypothetical protein